MTVFFIYFFCFIQSALVLKFALMFYHKKNFFSLKSALVFSTFLYITLPTLICSNLPSVVINNVIIPTSSEPLLLSSFFGLIFLLALQSLPDLRPFSNKEDMHWLKFIFFFLALVNFWYLLKFIYLLDVGSIIKCIESQNTSAIRDLLYQNLIKINITYGYSLKALQIALFGCLWTENRIKKKFLFAGILPLLTLDLISLSRLSITSFFVVLFFCLERKGKFKNFYITGVGLLLLLFFIRPIIFIISSDIAYENWSQVFFSPEKKGAEAIGEFFNTFGTFLMVFPLDQAKFNFKEVFYSLVSVSLIPPGFSGYFYKSVGEIFPIFRIEKLILDNYHVHPAHSSLVDIYTFRWWGVVGLFSYLYIFARVSERPSGINKVIYFYLLAVFYLPFRGSLTLNALRIFWLFFGLFSLRYLVNKLIHFIKSRAFLL